MRADQAQVAELRLIDALAVRTRYRVANDGHALDTSPMSVAPDPARLWLVDGFNLLHGCYLPEGKRVPWWLPEYQARVREAVRPFASRHPVWVIFDARLSPVARTMDQELTVLHVPNADEFIAATAAKATETQPVGVVSADRSLCDRCYRLGAVRLSPWAFREWLALR